jgi:hypothetical protein
MGLGDSMASCKARWGEGFVCPRCGSTRYCRLARGLGMMCALAMPCSSQFFLREPLRDLSASAFALDAANLRRYRA